MEDLSWVYYFWIMLCQKTTAEQRRARGSDKNIIALKDEQQNDFAN